MEDRTIAAIYLRAALLLELNKKIRKISGTQPLSYLDLLFPTLIATIATVSMPNILSI